MKKIIINIDISIIFNLMIKEKKVILIRSDMDQVDFEGCASKSMVGSGGFRVLDPDLGHLCLDP